MRFQNEKYFRCCWDVQTNQFQQSLPSHLFAHTTAYRRCVSFVPQIRHFFKTDPRRRVSRRSRRRYEAHCGPERRATHAHAVFEAVENSSQWRDPANCTMAFFESTNGLTMFSKSCRLFQTIPLLLLTKAEQCTYNMGTPPGVKGGSSPNTTICSSFGDVINQAERDGDGSCTIYFRGGGVAYQEKHRKTSWATTILVG